MTAEDVQEVYDIEKNTFAIPWSLKSFLNDINNNKCARYLVACIDNRIIGYCGIWIILDEGHITNIAISKDFQGKGIGFSLFESIIEYSSNLCVKYITLEVRKSNIIAQNLYKKLGFYSVSTRKNYYEDNHEDALLMVSEINNMCFDGFSDTNYLKNIIID